MSALAFVLFLDLLGTFAFALNGALTAARTIRLDIVGVLVLGVVTAVGGGIVRDVLIGAIPPAAFTHWYYLAVAAAASLIAFFVTVANRAVTRTILVLDAIGLSLFCVVGAQKALVHGLPPVPAILLGALTGVGGGTLRDVLIRQVPSILTHGLYAIPALLGAAVTTLLPLIGTGPSVAAVLGALTCFGVRMVGVYFDLHAPRARVQTDED